MRSKQNFFVNLPVISSIQDIFNPSSSSSISSSVRTLWRVGHTPSPSLESGA